MDFYGVPQTLQKTLALQVKCSNTTHTHTNTRKHHCTQQSHVCEHPFGMVPWIGTQAFSASYMYQAMQGYLEKLGIWRAKEKSPELTIVLLTQYYLFSPIKSIGYIYAFLISHRARVSADRRKVQCETWKGRRPRYSIGKCFELTRCLKITISLYDD